MPRKRSSGQFPKPTNPVHPSLSSDDSAFKSKNIPRSIYSPPASTGNPVNDLIQRGRLSSPASPTSKRTESIHVQAQTLPPSLNAILHGSEAPLSDQRLMPGGRVSTDRGRGPAGPPPPSSWLQESSHSRRNEMSDLSIRERRGESCGKLGSSVQEHWWSRPVEPLPGLDIPDERSLRFQSLKRLAIDWEWFMKNDQNSLSSLSMGYKERLLYFMARYNPGSITPTGLGVLFSELTVLDAVTTIESPTHLDLATSVGAHGTFENLMDVFKKKSDLQDISASNSDIDGPIIADAWDAPGATLIINHPIPLFSSLTHLSLSRPVIACWKTLLSLAPHLTTLTHLSLAFWPSPTLQPQHVEMNSMMQIETRRILRRLSRATYCLKWLDLTGCGGWLWVLPEADWAASWRGLQTVKVGRAHEAVVDLDLDVKAGVDWYVNTFDKAALPLESRPEDRAAHGKDSWKRIRDWCLYVNRMTKLEAEVNRLIKLREAHAAFNKRQIEPFSVSHMSFQDTIGGNGVNGGGGGRVDANGSVNAGASDAGDAGVSASDDTVSGVTGGSRVMFEVYPNDPNHMATLMNLLRSRNRAMDKWFDKSGFPPHNT